MLKVGSSLGGLPLQDFPRCALSSRVSFVLASLADEVSVVVHFVNGLRGQCSLQIGRLDWRIAPPYGAMVSQATRQ